MGDMERMSLEFKVGSQRVSAAELEVTKMWLFLELGVYCDGIKAS